MISSSKSATASISPALNSSALSLYWAVSGIFLIGQTYLTRKLYPIKPVPEVEAAGSSKDRNKQQGKKKK